jgi:hypothetical protein
VVTIMEDGNMDSCVQQKRPRHPAWLSFSLKHRY